MAALKALVHGERTNAAIGWLLVGVIAVSAFRSLFSGDLLWGAFTFVVAAISAIPTVATGDRIVMVPWPLPAVLAAASIAGSFGLYLEIASAIAIATLAFVVVVELSAFTRVDMSRRFAVVFSVLTTMAIQGVVTIAQFYSDRWLGTEFLRSQTELQWDFVVVALVGIVVGGAFKWYFEQFNHVSSGQSTRSGA